MVNRNPPYGSQESQLLAQLLLMLKRCVLMVVVVVEEMVLRVQLVLKRESGTSTSVEHSTIVINIRASADLLLVVVTVK